MAHILGGVVGFGEQAGNRCHQTAEYNTRSHCHQDQLPVGIPNLGFGASRTQHLAHDNAYRIAHGQECHTAQIKQGGGDVHGRHHVQSAGGIALVQHSHAAGPEKFVGKQGHSLDHDALKEFAGDIQGAEHAYNEGIPLGMQMGPACHNGKLHEPGDHCCHCSTLYTHLGSAEVAEDQDVIQNQIDQHCGDAAHHGNYGLAGFPEGAGIGIAEGKGQEAPDHYVQIVQTVAEGACGGFGIAFAG